MCLLILTAGSNDTMRLLDLSWNSIRLKGATAVAKGLMVRGKVCVFARNNVNV